MPSVVKTGSTYQIWFLGSNNPSIDTSDWIQWKLGAANLTINTPPSSVGGTVFGVNKLTILLPWIVLAALVVTGGITLVYRRIKVYNR